MTHHSFPLRAVALLAAFTALSGQALPQDTNLTPDFCARLAKNVGVDKISVADGRTSWSANALNFGQRFLFGGTATTSVNVETIEPATLDDFRRAEKMCRAVDGGALCELKGPANFILVWKGNRSETEIASHETALVNVKGLKTSCETGAALQSEPAA